MTEDPKGDVANPNSAPESARGEVEAQIEADLAALKSVMDKAVGGGQPGGYIDEQLRALEEMHQKLQDLTSALQRYARDMEQP